jgi:hypothetical protein
MVSKNNQNCLNSFRENRHFVLWDSFERSIFLEPECSYSLGNDLWWIRSWVPNMNKIRPAVQTVAGGTSIHTYRQTAFQKPTFRIQKCCNRVYPSKHRDRCFQHHNNVSYILGTWASKSHQTTFNPDLPYRTVSLHCINLEISHLWMKETVFIIHVVRAMRTHIPVRH